MKISVITPFFNGNEYMPAYLSRMAENAKALAAQSADRDDSVTLEVILVNDSPETEIILPEGCTSLDPMAEKNGENALNNSIYDDNEIGGKPCDDDKLKDESTKFDKTVKNVNAYIFREMEIKAVTLSQNFGIHRARTVGLAFSDADFVMFLDQDDEITPDALSKLAASNVFKPKIDLVIANAMLEQRSGREAWYRTKCHKNIIWNLKTYLTIGTQIMSPGQVLIRRNAIPEAWCKNILTHNCCDDYYLWLLLLGRGAKAAYVDETLYFHRFTGANASLDMDETFESTLEMIDYLRLSDDLTNAQIDTLERMTRYKAAFRGESSASAIRKFTRRLFLSLRHPYLALANVIFKLRTGTSYGFNR